MRDDEMTNDERESPSGAMRSGEAAGTPGAPLPRTDPADTGVDDGGLDRARRRASGERTAGTLTEHREGLGDPDDGNHGIGGAPAGGTGI